MAVTDNYAVIGLSRAVPKETAESEIDCQTTTPKTPDGNAIAEVAVVEAS